MSVMICSDATLCMLAYLAPSTESRQAIASTLLRENALSFTHRYPGATRPVPMVPIRYEEPARRLAAVEILKLCDFYDYQACEHAAYGESAAASIVRSVRRAALDDVLEQQDLAESLGRPTLAPGVRLLFMGDHSAEQAAAIRDLPGYLEAPWGI